MMLLVINIKNTAMQLKQWSKELINFNNICTFNHHQYALYENTKKKGIAVFKFTAAYF
jgi:hypothetical protein